MEGKKVVIGIFLIVLIVSAITFGLYLLTRKDETENGGELVPNAIVEIATVGRLHTIV